MASTEIASRPSTADSHIFTIKAATLKFETRHDLLPYLTPLIENPDVEEVHLSGNTYGVEACEFLGQVLSTKKKLKVLFFALFFLCLLCVIGTRVFLRRVLTEQNRLPSSLISFRLVSVLRFLSL
jgi:Ran GTPase-activating protein (RanGAP) involved in mRNA processing and transport